MTHRRLTVLALAGLAGLASLPGLIAGAEPAPVNDPVVITDLAGRKFTVRAPVRQSCCSAAATFYELSLLIGDDVEDRLVAWGDDIQSADQDAYAKFIARYPRLARIPAVGSVFRDSLSAEQILALKPDLVVADQFMIERRYRSVAQLEKAGLPMLYLDESTDPLTGPRRSLLLLGTVLGQEARARAIAEFIDAETGPVLARLARVREEPQSLYLECGSEGAGIYGNTYGQSTDHRLSSWGSLLDRMRCRNIAAGRVSGMSPISPEVLLKDDPTVIVITGANWPAHADTMRLGYAASPAEARSRLQAFTKRPGWDHLRAVKQARVHGLFHGFCMHPTSFVALQQLAQWLYPEEFKDLRPEQRLREFHERFMPFPLEGTWAISLEAKP